MDNTECACINEKLKFSTSKKVFCKLCDNETILKDFIIDIFDKEEFLIYYPQFDEYGEIDAKDYRS